MRNIIFVTMLSHNYLMSVCLGSKDPAEASGRSCVNVLETSMNLYTSCNYKYIMRVVTTRNMKTLKKGSNFIKKRKEKMAESDQTRGSTTYSERTEHHQVSQEDKNFS